jgi:uncharacterized protein DUF5666
MRTMAYGVMAVVAAFATACGGDAPNGPSLTSASIDGAVRTSSAGSGPSAQPLRVSVAGTTMSTETGSNGRFAFINVPAGNVTMLFEGPGVNARLPIGRVQPGDHIKIGVTVGGSNARLDSREVDRDDDEDDNDEDEQEVEGRIADLKGACPNLTFTIGTTTVKTNGDTKFKDIACTALANGIKVEAEGAFVNGVLMAKEIEKD